MSKKNLFLGGVLVVLLALAYFYQGPLKEWQDNYVKEKNILAELNTLDIDRIEINEGDSSIGFLKEEGKWRIDGTRGFIVRENIMLNVIDTLNKASDALVEVISNNPDKKSEFMTDDSGIHIILKRGEEILQEFIIGNNTADLTGTYLSKNDISKTYIFKSNLKDAFDRDDWYDKTIFSAEEGSINKMRFQYPNREFTVEKAGEAEEQTWGGTLPYAFSVDDEKLEEVINIMTNLTSIEIPEQNFEITGLEKHAIIVEANGEELSNTLMVGDAYSDDLYYAKKGDSDNIYLITKEQKEALEIQIWELR